MDFFVVLGGVSSAITIADQRKKIQSKIATYQRYLVEGKLTVGVFGAGGVGKTTLAKYLTGDSTYIHPAYEESATDEKKKIGKNIIGHFWVAPGQERKMDTYWPEMYREISRGKVQRIINVVSYGYHSVDPKINYTEMKNYFEEGISQEEFLMKYLEDRRKLEIKTIADLSHRIKDSKNPVSLITLVTKQDLWWKDRDSVSEHYLNGAYNRCIEDILAQKGKEGFQHEYISISLVSNNFNIGNEIFKEIEAGYDENLRQANLNHFVSIFDQYLKRKS
jgi:hypothetical protein